ncbi:hypothetical protein ACQ4PT_064633 [Festuca glaucescens]
MVLVQVFTVVTMLMSKVALNAGMHPLVLLVYRNLVAAAVVAPLALILIKRLSLRAYPHAEGHFRRGRLGPSDLSCALYDQDSESIAHLMMQCSFSQQVWFDICSRLNLQTCMPDPNSEFNTWFETATANAETSVQKGVKSIITLTMWRLWKARNDAIFKNITPNRHDLVVSILEEAKLWMMAGARALRRLPLHARPPDVAAP